MVALPTTGLTTGALWLQATLVFLFTLALYCHSRASLNGAWILDDKGTITMNPVVRGETAWDQVWARDFWGHDQLAWAESHKSWRPICTASYRLNYALAGSTGEPFWFHVVDRVLHAATSALALPVAALSLATREAAYSAASSSSSSLPPPPVRPPRSGSPLSRLGPAVVAVFFAAHPIHVEAAANTTGRAEVLCALFYFLGFLVYAAIGAAVPISSSSSSSSSSSPPREEGWLLGRAAAGVVAVAVMLFFCWCSMLCKEHGITLPLMCVIWDAYIGTATSVPEVLRTIVNGDRRDTNDNTERQEHQEQRLRRCRRRRRRRRQCLLFLLRAALGAAGTVALVAWRLTKNHAPHSAQGEALGSEGEGGGGVGGVVRSVFSSVVSGGLFRGAGAVPDFSCEQNPAACLEDRGVRFLHYSWLWCFNFWLLAWPDWLCPDWSGPSIPILEHFWQDRRSPALLLLYVALAAFLGHTVAAALQAPLPFGAQEEEEAEDEGAAGGGADADGKEDDDDDDDDDEEKDESGTVAGDGTQTAAPVPAPAPPSAPPSAAVAARRTRSRRRMVWARLRRLEARRTAVTSAWWLLLTFVLSSNLLVYVGFVVADRTLYLPCFGYCLLLVQALFSLSSSSSSAAAAAASFDEGVKNRTQSRKGSGGASAASASAVLAVAAAVLAGYVGKQQAQTERWQDPVLLWGEAYRINPNSCITGGEYGMSLTNGQRPADAVPVLIDTHRRELSSGWYTSTIRRRGAGWAKSSDDPDAAPPSAQDYFAQWSRMSNLLQTRFKLVTAMGNAGLCGRALPLIEEALELIDGQVAEIDRQVQLLTAPDSGYDKSRGGLQNSKAYLLVARSRCSVDLATMGYFAGAAVSAQPSMNYAHEYARSVAGLIQSAKEQSGLEPEQVAVGWAPNPDPKVQVYERTFSFLAEPPAAS